MPTQKGKVFFKSEKAEPGFITMFGCTIDVLKALSVRFGWPSDTIKKHCYHTKGIQIPLKDVPQVQAILRKWGINYSN